MEEKIALNELEDIAGGAGLEDLGGLIGPLKAKAEEYLLSLKEQGYTMESAIAAATAALASLGIDASTIAKYAENIWK